MKLIYSRYHGTNIEDCENVAAGFDSLAAIEEAGEGYAIGVYDDETETFYSSETHLSGANADKLLQKKLYTLKAHGIEPKKIRMFKPSPTPPGK